MITSEQHIIKTDKSLCYLREDGIFYVEYFKDVICDVNDFVNTSNAYKELGSNQILKILAVFPEFTNITPEAREYLQKRKNVAIAEAIVFESLAQRLIFNYYKLLRQKKYPVQGFESKEKAIVWLKEM